MQISDGRTKDERTRGTLNARREYNKKKEISLQITEKQKILNIMIEKIADYKKGQLSKIYQLSQH